MSINLWSLVRFLHVTAAIGWVGGQLALSAVVVPVLRSRLAPSERGPVIGGIARRFALIANFGILPTSIITGIALAWHRGVDFGSFDDPGYGRLLGTKLVLVGASVGVAAVHGAVASSRPRWARPLAVGGLAVSLGVVVFATALVP